MKMNIPYGRQFIDQSDLDAVSNVLKSDFLTQGPNLPLFESEFSSYIGCTHSIAIANGTAALHLAAMAMNLQPGERVITTPITFAASANCIRYCGGIVEFCDIDSDSYLLDLVALEKMLSAKPKGYYKGIIPVDFGGLSVDFEKVRSLADQYGCWIIEDACHAPGASFVNSVGEIIKAGSCKYADAAIFSFHPVKHIACGEGGMITTNNDSIAQKLNLLRTHGITKDPNLLQKNDGGWYYEMVELGYNYRLTDMQAALGSSQLNKLDSSLEKRNEIAKKYDAFFEELGWKHQVVGPNDYHAYHLYIIEHPDRKSLYDYLRERGIYAQVHYIPVHSMPYYQSLGWKNGDMPNAEKYYEQCLSLPMYPTLTDEEVAYVFDSILNFASK